MISYKGGWMGIDGFRCAPHILRILALAVVLLSVSSAKAQSAAPRKPSGYIPASAAPLQVLRLPGEKPIKLYANSYALVIGASDYTNGWRKLPGVPDDVIAVSQALSAQGFDVTIVTDPTLAQMEAAIRKFIAEFGQAPENRLIVYYAGHGHTLKTNDGRQLGYIVPVDAPRPDSGVGAFKAKALSMESIEVYAKEIESKHALFVFDSCFSGTIFITKRASDVPEIISLKTTQPVRQFITAGSADQKVPDESIFRRQFIEGIKGGADRDKDGYITGSELGYFLETTVTNYSRRMQTPKFGPIRDPNLDKGDFVFELVRKSAAIVGAPAAPIGGGFNLEDLRKQDTTRKQWEQWQGKMKADFEAVSRFDGSAELKVEAWNRFLTSYGQDNPFSTEDEPLRALAKQKREQAQGDDERRKHEADAAAQRAEMRRLEEARREAELHPGKVFSGASVVPAMVVMPPKCLEWGAIALSDMGRVKQALQKLKLWEKVSVRRVVKVAGYWIFIPPHKSLEDAQKKVEELKRLGVEDTFILQGSTLFRYAISLGVFFDEEAANKYLPQLTEKGVRGAEVRPRLRETDGSVLTFKNIKPAMAEKVAEIQQEFPGSVIKTVGCR